MRILIISLLLLPFFSCDNTEDLFYIKNSSPTLTVYHNGSPVSNFDDSLKMGFPLLFSYSIADEEDLELILSNPENGLVFTLIHNSFIIDASSPGRQKVLAKTTDSFGLSSSVTLNFSVFHNLGPISVFSLFKIADRELEVDARASFDKDSRFGGKIVEYEYDMNGYIFRSPLSLVRYIFSSGGQKKIRVRVKDNSNAWSDWVEQFISV